MIKRDYDLWPQVNRYYFKDKFGSMYTVLKIKDNFSLQLQCVSKSNRGSIFCINPRSFVLQKELCGDIGISGRKRLKPNSKYVWER